jgi:hypothetical protein
MPLNAFVPSWQFGEVHEVRIRASAQRVYQALRAVTAQEIRFFRTLTWLRHPRLPWTRTRESILAPPPLEPVLAVVLRSGFALLADESPREIVVGMLLRRGAEEPVGPQAFARLDRPGYAKACMNFVATDLGDGWTHLRTETRVFATDRASRRWFGLYWRAIYPGSALIRIMWLQAVKARAEVPPAA